MKMDLKKQLFGKWVLRLLALTLIAFLTGIILIAQTENPSLLMFPARTSAILISLIVFTLGLLFFSYLTPVIMFFVGSHVGNLIIGATQIPLQALTISISAIIVSYAAIVIGNTLIKDMDEGKAFLKPLGISIAILCVGVGIATVGEILL